MRRDTTRARPDTVAVKRDSIVVPVPPRPDSIRVDSTPKRTPVRPDSIKTALPAAEIPVSREIASDYHWDREALFGSGALTLNDLLERIPGVTGFHSGWITGATADAYLGDPYRVRLFLDGIELDPLDARIGASRDPGSLELWTLEDLSIERGADELRVYARSWSVRRTTPYTRTDITTGDLSTDLYRGFFGRRYGHGEALQVGAQQFNTNDPRNGGGGNGLTLLSRIGWAKGRWGADAFVVRGHRVREVTEGHDGAAPLPSLNATNTEAYARLGWGTVERGPWLQLIASSLARREASARNDSLHPVTEGLAADSADTTRSHAQYVATGGVTWHGFRLSAADRMRVYERRRSISPSARASFDSRLLAASAFTERDYLSDVDRQSVTALLRPLSWIALSGAASRRSAVGDSTGPTSTALRAEAGLRVMRLWFTGGLLTRDTARIVAPRQFLLDTTYRRDSTTPTAASSGSRGSFVTIRGPIYRALQLDIFGVRWQGADSLLRPRFQSRAELFVRTRWLARFPSGNFGLLASVVHEYRSQALFPVSGGIAHGSQYRTLSGLLEIRIMSAVISYQYRNMLGEIYQQVPGYDMPRTVQAYGVRWEFWN